MKKLLLLILFPVALMAQQGTVVIKSGTSNRTANVDSSSSLIVRGSPDTPCYVQAGSGTTNDSTNHANCKATAGTFLGIRAINTTASLVYVHLYNIATNPSLGATAGFVETIPIPANTSGAGIVDLLSNFAYSTGIAYTVSADAAASGTDAPVAGVFITLSVN